MSQQRVITYIDGYNLYHGLLDARLHNSRWLDLAQLGRSLLTSDQQLALTRRLCHHGQLCLKHRPCVRG